MSWYAPIYMRVRLYRQKNPIRGWLLSSSLNLLLLIQVVGHCYSIYVYVFHILGHFIPNCIQAAIYLGIYATFSLMAMWSLMTAIFWPVKRVPNNWKVCKEKADELKKVTPREGDRYVVDKSSSEQTEQQIALLSEIARDLGIQQAECDQAGRLKFCYQCEHMKPDRTHHCSSCGFCVVRFDHHCPWINHCVNYNNYKFFILYLIYAILVIIWFLLGAAEALIRFFIRQEWEQDWRSIVHILLVVIPFAIFGYYPLGELLLYHWGLMSINETTCEQAKPANLRNDFNADYNIGRWQNIKQIFGWGLWMFPMPTQIEDGMHFLIRYVEPANHLCYRRVEVTSPQEADRSDSQGDMTAINASIALKTTATTSTSIGKTTVLSVQKIQKKETKVEQPSTVIPQLLQSDTDGVTTGTTPTRLQTTVL